MSARMASRTMRSCAQSVRMASRQFNRAAQTMGRMPEMKMKFAANMPAMEFMSRNANKFAQFAKVNKCELQRLQAAAITVLLTSSANSVMALADMLSSSLTADEDEEGSSSGVRRRKTQ
ncbi:histone-lysine N-methyltransferase ATXR3 [Blastocystis sp. ATCC 50177/Nand II]|uniref:Histone-lysine N-methyltransferase ATXR3 n=1 Tax=Blastocystis sp. subtype 1 (strain ATCC 50177 / NandII) TaxID=478820 RepID=A0A196SGT1_BLAHN|nr:histone-lysine N-methyltransferase ATXR3 [Blastocystis sp. ATCC 50177/Nand II]